MNLKAKLTSRFRSRLAGAGFTAFCGLALWYSPVGESLIHLSYDLPYAFSPKVDCAELIIIKMDEQSYRATHQEWGRQWSRALHTELLQNLKRDHSGPVVFDIWFASTNQDGADEALARAIKSHGHVVLPGILAPMAHPDLAGKQTLQPAPIFLEAAANWGISEYARDADLTVRQHYKGTESDPSLAWAGAALAGAPICKDPSNRAAERWMRYYGANGILPSLSYYLALQKPAGYFKDKYVFIGGKPAIRYAGETVDEFRTPYTRWSGGEKTSGVEINATMFLNLLHGDWLMRLSSRKESWLLAMAGLLLGYGLAQVRPMVATGLAVLVGGLIALAAMMLVWKTHVWFSWMIITTAQVPCALAWSILTYTKILSHEKEVLTHEKEVLQIQLETSAHGSIKSPHLLLTERGTRLAPLIHDHTLVRCVGKGAYGQVWLAVNAIEMYHAIKIVDQTKFRTTEPYTREFRGIQKYMPISLNHPGLVHILHVGRDDQAGYFYYVMEAGDDEVDGIKINPQTYVPRDLAKDLSKRGKLPIPECVSMGLALTDALEFLHQQKLIHRDIKPSNIIFVKSVPKLADIGLVTDIGAEGKNVTNVGTEGYLAPEGPGTPAADVYSMGKVLYVAATGFNIHRFPELPRPTDDRDTLQLMRLNTVILRACEAIPGARYQSAAELRANLLDLDRHIKS